MDKNSLGKLYTLRESIVAAVTCTAHCNLNRVFILALDLLVLVILKDYNLKTTNKLAGSKLFHHIYFPHILLLFRTQNYNRHLRLMLLATISSLDQKVILRMIL